MTNQERLLNVVCRANMDAVPKFRNLTNYLLTGVVSDFYRSKTTLSKVEDTLKIDDDEFVIVEGDVSSDIILGRGSVLLVHGNLAAKITANGLAEICIYKDIQEGGTVVGDMHLIVCGNVKGRLRTRGISFVWIEGNMLGSSECGVYFSLFRIKGDCFGKVISIENSQLELDVCGFMPSEKLDLISDGGFSTFKASIGRSDHCPGVYPNRDRYLDLAAKKQYCFWVILNQIEAPRPAQ